MTNKRQINTLMLIDDDELDHILCQRVVDQSGLVENFIRFYYAEEALQYLRDKSNPKVDIIALDINMPRMDGFEFLRAATSDPGDDLAKAVVVMLTTSALPANKKEALQYAIVRRYINKPLTSQHLQDMLDLI